MKKCYIAGKIGDLPEEEFMGNFAKARDEVTELGYEPICPTQLPHDHEKTWLAYMREDVAALLKCDAVYAQRNWHISKGARIEVAIAWMLGIEIIYQPPILKPMKPNWRIELGSVQKHLTNKIIR